MKPVVVIGGGIAGLAACWMLRENRVEHLLLEAGAALTGGRCETIRGDGWAADPGTPYVRKNDRTIMAIAREYGLDRDLVTIQDAILHMTDAGVTKSVPRDYNSARVTLRDGMDSLFTEAGREIELIPNAKVEAIRWLADDGVFEFRDAGTGKSLRHPVSRRVIRASAVVLAVNGSAAQRIAAGSSLLAPLAEPLQNLRFKPNLVGLYKVPRIDPGCYALERNPSPDVQWIGFEERKVPSRVTGEWSLVVARAGEVLSEELLEADEGEALDRIWSAVRAHVPALAEEAAERRLIRYPESRPVGGTIVRPQGMNAITNPPEAPLMIAGDWCAGKRAEDAARSGVEAVRTVLARRAALI